MHLIDDHAHKNEVPIRFAASKIIEGDQEVIDRLHLDQNEKENDRAYYYPNGKRKWHGQTCRFGKDAFFIY